MSWEGLARCGFELQNCVCALIPALRAANRASCGFGGVGASRGSREGWHHQDVIIRMQQESPGQLPQTPELFSKPFLCIFCSVYCPGKPCLSQSLAIPFPPRHKALGLLLCPSHHRAQELQKDGSGRLFCFKKKFILSLLFLAGKDPQLCQQGISAPGEPTVSKTHSAVTMEIQGMNQQNPLVIPAERKSSGWRPIPRTFLLGWKNFFAL